MACNGILSCCRSVNEFVKLGLVRAVCLPRLSYCIGALDLMVTCITVLAFCWNDSFWKIFGYKKKRVHEVTPILLLRIAFWVYRQPTVNICLTQPLFQLELLLCSVVTVAGICNSVGGGVF